MNDWVTAQKEELRSDILKLILYELNTAVSPQGKRIAALQAAIDEFNHNNPTKHDQELELHADKILFQKLSYCFTVHKHHEELGMICCALEMVYRANRSRVALSFQEIGDCILPLFVEIIRWSAARRRYIWKEQNSSGGMMSSTGSYTSSNSGTSAMNSGSSLQSILKTDSATLQTPLRSNKTIMFNNPNGLPELPDRLPEDKEFTIEFIPNGTETNIEMLSQVRAETNVPAAQAQVKPNLPNSPMQESKKPDPLISPIQEGIELDLTNEITPSIAKTCDVQENSTASTSDDSEIKDDSLHVSPEQVKHRQVRFSKSIESHQVLDDSTRGKADVGQGDTGHALRLRERFTHPLAILKLLKILRYFSRVLSAMVPMAHFPGLLDELIFQMKNRSGVEGTEGILRSARNYGSSSSLNNSDRNLLVDDDLNSFHSARSSEQEGSSMNMESFDGSRASRMSTNNSMNSAKTYPSSSPKSTYLDNASAARMDAIATVVNLACAEENKTKLMSHPGLLDAVISVAESDVIDDAREHASIVIMNLALAEENKLGMANRGNLLNIILKLMTDEVVNTRRYASATFLTLVGVPQNTYRIAKFGNGKLLHDLINILANDKVEEIRINIAEGFFNLVRNSTKQETIELIGRHRHVLKGLTSTVLTDYSADVRAYAARTLEWLSADIHYGSTCHNKLLNALIEASKWTKTTCIVEALKAQATIEENRRAMVETPQMLDALTSLASLHGVNDEEVRECALATIERLTCERSTRKTMAMHEGIMMELTRATFSSNGILDQFEESDKLSRSLMKAALKNLAEEI